MRAAVVIFGIMLSMRSGLARFGVRAVTSRMRLGPLAARTNFALYSTPSESDDKEDDALVKFRRGDEISAVVTQFGPLGASVTVNGGNGYGLILQSEIAMYRDKHGIDVVIGDSLDAYVEHVRDDGKLHVFLRPVTVARLGSVAEQVMEALEGSPDLVIPVGDKSSPEDIAAYFYGISKRDFKNAVGTLYKEGKARPGPFTTELISDEEREAFLTEKAVKQAAKTSKRFEGDKHDQAKTIFVGNLPFETNEVILTNTVNKILGSDKHSSVRLALDETGRSRGFGYVEMKEQSDVDDALQSLRGVEVMGRKMRTDYAESRARGRGGDGTGRTGGKAGREKGWVDYLNNNNDDDGGKSARFTSSSSSSSSYEEKEGGYDRRRQRGSSFGSRDRGDVEASLYIGNLPYSSTTETIRDFLSSCEDLDMGTVGSIRMGTDPDGRSRGFCHVDFYTEEGAKAVYEGLHEQEIEGRKVRIDEASRRQR